MCTSVLSPAVRSLQMHIWKRYLFYGTGKLNPTTLQDREELLLMFIIGNGYGPLVCYAHSSFDFEKNGLKRTHRNDHHMMCLTNQSTLHPVGKYDYGLSQVQKDMGGEKVKLSIERAHDASINILLLLTLECSMCI